MPTAEVFTDWKTSTNGLPAGVIAQRQAQYGPNVLRGHVTTPVEILIRQLKSPFIYLLVGAGVLSYGLHQQVDGVLIFAFIVINTVLGFFQEYRSAKALQMLQRFAQPQARVIRDGREMFIAHRDLVPGGVILLRAGDIVPADARLVSEDAMTIDESVLTGESREVRKSSQTLTTEVTQPYQATNIAFAGSTVISGSGQAVVIATGRQTMMGEISRLAIETEKVSGFQKGIAGFSRFVLMLISLTLVLVFTANIAVKGTDAPIVELLIFSIALAVSVVPEALPVVTTLAMSRGALKLARKHVVVKRLSAIEDLGSIDVLCTDKTGTITEGVMRVADLDAPDHDLAILTGILGSVQSIDEHAKHQNAFTAALWEAMHDSMRSAVTEWKMLHIIPFDPIRRRETVMVTHGRESFVISRGAPEVVLSRTAMTKSRLHQAMEWTRQQGTHGHRVMAIARKKIALKSGSLHDADEQKMTLIGLIAFADPLKLDAAKAIHRAKQLGVSVKILTGDAPEVAGSIGQQVGLLHDGETVVTGEQFDALPSGEQHRIARANAVFARLTPQQKFTIIRLLEETQQVGFLGEGINDAPALKVATVSLVVQEASDVARESADIILLKKDLSVIIRGIAEGRTVFANTIKYIKSTLLSNFGNFFAVASATLFVEFLPLLPVQILLVNLLSDFPMIAIASDGVDTPELKRPRHYQVRDIALFAIVLGLISTIFDFLFFAFFARFGAPTLQTYWFIGSILTELLVIYSIRTHRPFWKAARPGRLLAGFTSLAAVVTLLLPFTTIGQSAFHFLRPTAHYLTWTLVITLAYFFTNEIVKLGYYRWTDRQPRQHDPRSSI